MKKAKLFSLLAMLLLFAGNAMADELFYTLWTVPFTEGTNHTDYSKYFDDEHDGMIWNAPGNQSLEGKWRIGGKSLDGVDRTITAKSPMGSAISRVVLNHLGVSREQVTVNSLTLTIASDAEYSSILDEVELTPTIAAQTAGSVDFVPASGTSWATGAYYKLTINLSNTLSSNGGLDVASIQFYAPDGGAYVAKPVIEPAGGTFAEPQEVTLTAGEGCSIFYTTDGTEPTEASTLYSVPFTVSQNCTVKAIAYDADDNASAVASAEFKFNNAVFTSIADLCAAATSTSTPVNVQFNNWVCTGVSTKNASNAYFTDGVNGILLYQKEHGFEVGDQISGTASINLTIYNDCAEVTGLSATTEGISVTKGVTVNPIATTIDQLDKSMQGCLIYLANVTYEGGVFKDATGQITPYNIFTTLPTLTEGGAYNATGVAVWFKKEGIWEIAPRTADEFAEASVAVAKPLIVPSGGVFAEPQQVTITAQEGCTIMYTTDGTEPSATVGSRYTAPFMVSEECTVKAVAINKENKVSAVATAEFRFIADEAIQSIAALCAATPAEGTADVLVSIKNWIVTGVKGNQLFFTDGKNGIVNYCKGHGFEVGDIVNGEAVVTLTIFNECAEITSLTAATEGITVTKGEGATPMTVAIADLQKDMQGCLLYFEGLTYSAEEGAFIDDDDNKIVPNNKFVSLPELINGQTYNVTGVAVWFVQSGGSSYWAIAPRTADEFVLVTSQIAPISSWSVESETVDVNGKVTATFTTNSDGQVTYESSDETVATIDAEGNITPVGRGVATITANVAETETYLPDSKSFTLTVTEAGYEDATFAYNDEDIQGQGAPDTGSELTATRGVLTLYANKAYAKVGDTHIKIYGSKFEGKDEDKVLTEPSFIQLSVPEGYIITDIVLTATGEGYIKEWADQNDNAAVIEGNTATWKGEQSEVVLTNQAGAQARIKTIAVTFKNTGSAGMEGDLNGDEKVDIADAVAVLEVMARDGNDPEADLNGDGKVDIADFVAVLEIMAKQ